MFDAENQWLKGMKSFRFTQSVYVASGMHNTELCNIYALTDYFSLCLSMLVTKTVTL